MDIQLLFFLILTTTETSAGSSCLGSDETRVPLHWPPCTEIDRKLSFQRCFPELFLLYFCPDSFWKGFIYSNEYILSTYYTSCFVHTTNRTTGTTRMVNFSTLLDFKYTAKISTRHETWLGVWVTVLLLKWNGRGHHIGSGQDLQSPILHSYSFHKIPTTN